MYAFLKKYISIILILIIITIIILRNTVVGCLRKYVNKIKSSKLQSREEMA